MPVSFTIEGIDTPIKIDSGESTAFTVEPDKI